MRCIRAFLLLSLLPISGPSGAQEAREAGADTAPPGTAAAVEDDSAREGILVIGSRQQQIQAVRDLTAAVTKKGPADKPLPRFYQPFCPKVLAIQEGYAAVLTERIRSNANAVDVGVAAGNCHPNALLIFARDASETLKTLRKEQPWFFTDLSEFEVNRLAKGGERVFAWQTTEVRGVDGRPMRVVEVEIGNPPVRRELTINEQRQTGRLNQPVRVDLSGAIVLIDYRYISGKTLTQLADYASVRLLASTNDLPAEEAVSVPSILSLFTTPESAPPGLTPFDIGYLRARYSLRANANALAIKDATVRTYLREIEK